jgi:hypothetical protein
LSKSVTTEGAAGIAGKTNGLCLQIDRIINSVRRIASGLRPEVLDEIGLAAAIEWQAREFQRRTGIRCLVDMTPGLYDPTRKRATALFRIFQELLTNVARHAHATRVSVQLQETDHSLSLSVEDNGRGIQEQEFESPRSLGFLGLRERVLAFGGSIEVKDRKGRALPCPSRFRSFSTNHRYSTHELRYFRSSPRTPGRAGEGPHRRRPSGRAPRAQDDAELDPELEVVGEAATATRPSRRRTRWIGTSPSSTTRCPGAAASSSSRT